MLVIRQTQIDQLRGAALRAFEAELVERFSAALPSTCRGTRRDLLQGVVQNGIARAAEYGFHLRGPVRLYVESMLRFGCRFDTDPQYPWAGPILRDASDSELISAHRLRIAALRHVDRVHGRQDAQLLRALGAFAMWLRYPVVGLIGGETEPLTTLVGNIYPESAAELGPEGLRAAAVRALKLSAEIGLPVAPGACLLLMLQLLLGHTCLQDALHPWIAEALAAGAGAEPGQRADAMREAALAWLDAILGPPAQGLVA